MPTITEYLKYANLQMAAEALYGFDANANPNLVPKGVYSGALVASDLTTGNRHASKFTLPEIELSKLTTDWVVVEHISNTETGFSGTLFKNKDDGKLVLSFRSTEFLDDAARDNEAINYQEISKLGFAFGQISDMEKWYGELTAAGRITGPLSVTGYSLGGHLATAFNLLHPGAATEVVTFNGAGIGRIGTANGTAAGTGQELVRMVARFRELRIEGDNIGLAPKLSTEAGRTTYQALKTALVATNGVPYDGLVNVVNSMPSNAPNEPRTGDNQADYLLLWTALDRALAVTKEAARVKTLASGVVKEGEPSNPAQIPDLVNGKLAIVGESLDYQLAVLVTAREFNTSPLGLWDGAMAAMGARHMGDGVATTGVGNQWDLAGTEMDAQTQRFMATENYPTSQRIATEKSALARRRLRGQRQQMADRRMRTTWTTFLSVLLLSACAGIGAGGSRSWKEQVILPDGRELIVERSHTLGNRFDRELSAINAPPGATAYVVTVPLPDGRKVSWEADHKDMIPIAVAVERDTAYLVASPFNCRSYAKLGRPVPPFIVFKNDGKKWMRTTVERVPEEIREANLMIDTANSEIDQGLVTAKSVKRLNEAIVRRHIYRQGVDKYLWGGCLRELEAGWDSQEHGQEK